MKIKEFIKRNTTGVIIGAVFFGGITGVVAATALTAADVTYTGNNQTTVKSALDDLYTKAEKLNNLEKLEYLVNTDVSYAYWNDNFSYITYTNLELPKSYYNTREALISANGSSNFSKTPIYIKSTKVNGQVMAHAVCAWYNNNEFCFPTGYWVETGNGGTSHMSVENGIATKNKLKLDMETKLHITITDSSCGSDNYCASCNIDAFRCQACAGSGIVSCQSNISYKFCAADDSNGGLANCEDE